MPIYNGGQGQLDPTTQEYWDSNLLNNVSEYEMPDIASLVGENYDENFRTLHFLRLIRTMFGYGIDTATQETVKWFEDGRYATRPVNISTAERCTADGTPSGSGAYVRANIATTSVYGGAGTYKSDGGIGGRVYVMGNNIDGEHYTIIARGAPTATNTGHYWVLQLNTNTTTTPAALVTEINGTGASLVLYSYIHNDLSVPVGTTFDLPLAYTAQIQQVAREISYTKTTDARKLWINLNGKPYFTTRIDVRGAFQAQQDKDKQIILGEEASTASTNEQGLQSTAGLLKTAKNANEFFSSLALITSGNPNDWFSALNILADISNDLSANGRYAFLNGSTVQKAWQQGSSVAAKNAGAYLMSDEKEINVLGNTSKLRDYSNMVAFKFGEIEMFNIAIPYLSDKYLTNDTELPQISIMLPVGDTRIFDTAAGEIIQKPMVRELALVDSSGRRLSYDVNGPIGFGLPNPIPTGLNVKVTHMRHRFGIKWMGTSQYAMVRYS